jgi:hypothetical protein
VKRVSDLGKTLALPSNGSKQQINLFMWHDRVLLSSTSHVFEIPKFIDKYNPLAIRHFIQASDRTPPKPQLTQITGEQGKFRLKRYSDWDSNP